MAAAGGAREYIEFASVLSEADILALKAVKDDTNLIGAFIGAYCAALNASFEVFHDTVAFAATVLHSAGMIENKETFASSHDIGVVPIRKLNRTKEAEAIERLKEDKIPGHPELSKEAIEEFAKFGDNRRVIDGTLLASACQEYADYLKIGKSVQDAASKANGNPYIWRMFELLGSGGKSAEKSHMERLGKTALELKGGAQVGWRLAEESVGHIIRGEEAFIKSA